MDELLGTAFGPYTIIEKIAATSSSLPGPAARHLPSRDNSQCEPNSPER